MVEAPHIIHNHPKTFIIFASIKLPKIYLQANKTNKPQKHFKKMLISPTPFRLIHQLLLVLALFSLFINTSNINLVRSSSKGCPIHIGPNFMSQGNLHRGNARGNLDADYLHMYTRI
jgi:hypothetical protein